MMEKAFRRLVSLLLALVMAMSLAVSAAAENGETGGLHNFARVNTYAEGQYSDVPPGHTFSENVKAGYEFDIMQGYGMTFAVDSNITRLASIIIACRLNCIYDEGANRVEALYSGTTEQIYMAYAKDHGILCDFDDVSKPATRAEFAAILSGAFPHEALSGINTVADGAIPDVGMGVKYADAIYRLYRAGILVGSDAKGTFYPNSYITRGAACAIATRMCDEALRKSVSLTFKPQGPLPVLMYHHMVPEGEDCNSMTVTPSKFKADMKYLLQKGYTPILPRDLVSGSALPKKPILITFDDGYTSNYTLLFPLLQELNVKVNINIIVCMPDIPTTNFMTWDMLREMSDSGLVEIGSHTYRLHNLGGLGGNFVPNGVNGIQRRPGETDAEFRARVLDDIQKSHDRIEEELGVELTCFAYPFGVTEPDAQNLVNSLFPVTLKTNTATADLGKGVRDLPRYTVTMQTKLSSVLK